MRILVVVLNSVASTVVFLVGFHVAAVLMMLAFAMGARGLPVGLWPQFLVILSCYVLAGALMARWSNHGWQVGPSMAIGFLAGLALVKRGIYEADMRGEGTLPLFAFVLPITGQEALLALAAGVIGWCAWTWARQRTMTQGHGA
jgi:hypothetical protein